MFIIFRPACQIELNRVIYFGKEQKKDGGLGTGH